MVAKAARKAAVAPVFGRGRNTLVVQVVVLTVGVYWRFRDSCSKPMSPSPRLESFELSGIGCRFSAF